MNYLVTGAAGFIGCHTALSLLQRGDTVVGLDNLNDTYSPLLKKDRLCLLNEFKNFHFYQTDLTDSKALAVIFQQYSIHKVCHLAAQAGVRQSVTAPLACQRANVEGFIALLEAARLFKVKNFVYASSSSVYGNNKKLPFCEYDRVDQPASVYAATKKAGELLAHAYHHLYGLKCTGLRFFTVYGPWGRPDMAYFRFTRAIIQGENIELYNYGESQRDFSYVGDIVRGINAALDLDCEYEIFNLGSGKPLPVKTLVETIERYVGKKAVIRLLPQQPGDVPTTWADTSYAEKKLGFRPTVRLEEGMADFIAWFLKMDATRYNFR